jgi:hypothetical protein
MQTTQCLIASGVTKVNKKLKEEEKFWLMQELNKIANCYKAGYLALAALETSTGCMLSCMFFDLNEYLF